MQIYNKLYMEGVTCSWKGNKTVPYTYIYMNQINLFKIISAIFVHVELVHLNISATRKYKILL